MSTLSRLFLCVFIMSMVTVHHAAQDEANTIAPIIIAIAAAFFFVVMGTVDAVEMRGK